MSGLMSEVKQGQAVSYNDLKAQEVHNIGRSPVRAEVDKAPTEKSLDEKVQLMQPSTPMLSVTIDANIQAKQLTSLDGLPQ